MDITSAQGFLQFITQVKNSRSGGQISDLVAELKAQGNFPGNRKKSVQADSDSTPSAEAPASEESAETVEAEEDSSSEVADSSTSNALDELASLYIKQYEQGAGVTLSDEVFEQKKSEVIELYSRLGSNRLDDIVFSNDVDQTA